MKNINIEKIKVITQLKKQKFKKRRKFYKHKKNNAKKSFSRFYKLPIIFFMIIFLLFMNYISQNIQIMNLNLFNIKVCICTLGKEENKYILEFIEHYKKIGVDKIYLYDNSNIDGEHFEEVIDKYIKSGFVEIVDFRGGRGIQTKIVNDCYRKTYMY